MPLSDADVLKLLQPSAAQPATGGLSDAQVQAMLAQQPQQQTAYDPASGGSTLQFGPWDTGIPVGEEGTRRLAGIGEGLNNDWLGLKERASQLVDAVTGGNSADAVRADIAQHRAQDVPLNATSGGRQGNMLGTVAGYVPTMFIPGANTLTGAAAIGAGAGYAQPSLSSTETIANTAGGAAGGAAGYGLGKLVSALAMPAGASSALTAAQSDAARSGQSMGFQLTPGKQSGSAAQQQVEAMLMSRPETSGPFNAISASNQSLGNQIAARSIGIGTDDSGNVVSELSAPVLQSAQERIGAVFDRARDIAAAPVDGDSVLSSLASIESDHAGQYMSPGNAIYNNDLVKQFLSHAANGEASGAQLVSLSSNLGKSAKAQMTNPMGDRALGDALFQVKDVVDGTLQDAAGPELSDALGVARGQYRNLMNLTARQNIVNPSSGNVNMKTLASALMQKDRSGFTFGGNESELYNAARFAQAFPDIVGNSGTATRMPLSIPQAATNLAYGAASRAYMNPMIRGVGTTAYYPASKMATLLQMTGVPQIAPQIGAGAALSNNPLSPQAQ